MPMRRERERERRRHPPIQIIACLDCPSGAAQGEVPSNSLTSENFRAFVVQVLESCTVCFGSFCIAAANSCNVDAFDDSDSSQACHCSFASVRNGLFFAQFEVIVQMDLDVALKVRAKIFAGTVVGAMGPVWNFKRGRKQCHEQQSPYSTAWLSVPLCYPASLHLRLQTPCQHWKLSQSPNRTNAPALNGRPPLHVCWIDEPHTESSI